MEAPVKRRTTRRPITHYWGILKDLDDSQKLELVTMLIESVKPKVMAASPMKRYTMDDIHAMIDEAEAEISAGGGIPDEEVWRKYDEEFALEEQQDIEMA